MCLVLFLGLGSSTKNYAAITVHFLEQVTTLPVEDAATLLKGLTVNTRG